MCRLLHGLREDKAMKKTVLILMLALLPLTAQARSVKLGENSDVFTGTKSVRKKVCTENKQCITGLCVSGNCVRCNDTDKVCPSDKTCVSGVCKKKADCAQTSDCEAGYDCVSGACIMCASGDKGCNCGDTGANGYGGCLCASGSFQYDGKCVKYCDYTTCASGLTKVEKDGRCCCK